MFQLPSFVWSEEYQRDLFSRHFKAFDILRQYGWFIGEFIWNFADFKTNQCKLMIQKHRNESKNEAKSIVSSFFFFASHFQHIHELVAIKRVYSPELDNQKRLPIMYDDVIIHQPINWINVNCQMIYSLIQSMKTKKLLIIVLNCKRCRVS